MRTLLLGVRNVYRNQARATLMVLVLALCVGVFVTMMKTSATTAAEARALKAKAATRIEANEAGNTSGYAGTVTQDLLPADVSRLVALPHVIKVERYLKRQFVDNKRNPPTGVLIGVEPGATLRLQSMGGFVGSPRLLAGREFTPGDTGKAVAIVGKAFARSRGVDLGDEFTLPGAEVQRGKWIYPHAIKDLKARVIGIFEVRVVYPDNQVFAPLDVVQDIMGIGRDRVSQYIVTADSAENVPAVATALKGIMGKEADVIAQDQTALQAAKSLDAVSANSLIGAGVAAGAGALVVLFTMLLVTRERTRELGILKAIGASNAHVATLFTAETLALTVLGGLLGLGVYAFGGSMLGFVFLGATASNVSAVAPYALGATELAQGLGLACVFGLIGSLYAVTRGMLMRPADAIRQQ
ncbi:MAG: ABC transporter permease [Pseudomonadota bacterium]